MLYSPDKNGCLLFDGAMGTYFLEHGDAQQLACETANLSSPHLIANIHKSYIAAGANAIKTNTFGANTRLTGGDFAQVRRIIEAAWSSALKAADGDAYVFADIGPIPLESEDDSATAEYHDIVDTFLSLGAENFLLETFPECDTPIEIASYIKQKCPKSFVICSFSVTPDGFTKQGVQGASLINRVRSSGCADAFGFNCLSGPSHLAQLVKEYNWTGCRLSVMPNAGYPAMVSNRTVYMTSPEYFAEKMLEIYNCGASILGGCCGTTPAHIAALSRLLKASAGRETTGTDSEKDVRVSVKESRFSRKLAEGKRVVAVELDSPADGDMEGFISAARSLRDAGADILTVADCPVARARMDSSLLAAVTMRETQIEIMPHLTCRDRNLNATKALLLGLNGAGISDVLVVTGDPVQAPDKNEIQRMMRFHSLMLAGYISDLNSSVFASSPFAIGGALNINAVNFPAELGRAQKKEQAGITRFLTQPVFTEQAIENLSLARKTLKSSILGGIMPLVSYRNASFAANEIAGITVPDEIVERYRGLSREQSAELAVELSCGIAEKISDFVDGYYLITPFRRVEIINEILGRLYDNGYCG